MRADLPITAIEGIGPARAERLAEIGVERVLDLFFVSDAEVHHAVTNTASADEARAWRSMAALMELDAVDGQRAEALVAADIETVDELARQGLAMLRQAFADAVEADRIDQAPDDEELLEMVRQATHIDRGGVAIGTLVDEAGAPVAEAAVRVGEQRTVSAANGRFRVAGIRPAARHHLRAELPDREPFVVLDYRVLYDPRLIGGPTLTWDDQSLPGLDEYDGDVLPTLDGVTTAWQRMEPDALREGDVLHVHDLYASAPDAKVVSIFRAFEVGELVIRHARVPLARFALGDAAVGDLVRLRGGELRPVPGGLNAVETHRAARKALRELRELGGEVEEMDTGQAISWFGGALRRHHVLAHLTAAPHDSADGLTPTHEGASDDE